MGRRQLADAQKMEFEADKTEPIRLHKSFRLWHLFVLTLATAVWFATLRFSQNLAIASGVSFVPGTLCFVMAAIFLNRRVAKLSAGRKAFMLTLMSFACFVTYVLSIGPAIAIVEATNSGEDVIRIFYGPVIWLHDHTFLHSFLEWYSELWGWR